MAGLRLAARGAMTASIAIASAAGTAVALAQNRGWQADPATVKRVSTEQPGFNYDETRVGAYELPDPLAVGEARITTAGAWTSAGRARVLELFRSHVYGRSPGRPETLSFDRVEENAGAMDGGATLRRIAVVSGQSGRTHRFELTVFLPNRATGRVPVFLLLNNRPVTNVDPTRKERSGFWPAEDLIARGYGIAAIQNDDLAPDHATRAREGVISLFQPSAPATPAPDGWGAIAAWAWGASRVMDYFATDDRVDPARVAVVGHSRGGKAALWAGANDERFAMVVSNESGEGGAALGRRDFGETIARITTSFPHWFAPRYATYAGRPATLPVDQHLLLSLVAPRALYVASADQDLWSDPRGEFLSLAASSPVYSLFGQPAIGPGQMPALEAPLVVGRRGYHVRSGVHNLTPSDWQRFADFADRVWTR